MKPARFEDVYELSPMQQGILFHTLYDPAADLYFEQCVLTVRGDLNGARFAQAWQRVAARHVILRTSFHWEGLEKPVQVVHPNAQVPVESRDCRDLSLDAQQNRLDTFLQEDRKEGFDLASQPLLRLTLLRTAEDLHECVLSFQHLVLDRWSLSLVLKEVFVEYAAGSRGEDARLSPASSYGEYIAWIQGADRSGAEAFWRGALAGFTRPTSLRLDGRSGTPSAQGFEEASIRLSPQASTRLQSFARRHRLTLNTLVQGAWAVLASRYSGEEDVLFGTTVSGRPASLPDVESMVGLFINTLPVRVRVPESGKVIDWLRRLQEELLELRQYEHSSLVDIQGWSEVPRGTPLFESLVVFENVGGDFDSVSGDGPLKVLRVRSPGGWTNYPLTLLALPGPQLLFRILADRSIFDAPSILRMLGHLTTLLEGMAADPEQPLSRLPLLTELERRELLYDWNQTARAYPREKTVHGLFEEQAERSPDAEAVVFGQQRLSYGGLNERANRLARYLRKRGVGPEVLVGLCIERSLDMVVGLLGILKAGGAYVPLDPSYPRQRVAFMLEDTAARVVLTQESLSESLPEGSFERVRLDADWPQIALESGENPESQATAENLAYVIYTSGSTGTPKGVAIEHRNTVALLAWARQLFSDTELEGVLASTSICFDLSVFELFVPLAWGGKVVLAQNALELPQLPAAGEVKLVNTVPSAMTELLRMGELPDSVMTVNLAGEFLAASLVRQILWRGKVQQVFDLYGPTEDTTYSTCARRTAEGPATIGRPISNKRVYILNAHLQPVPVGVPGDLYVAGAGVARGYLNRPALTAERFLGDPFRAGARMYRTGDRARFLPGGDIQFLGRLDHQVKIRGYRIEIGEIEETLARHPEIRACAVAAREEKSGDRRLVGYVVPRNGSSPSVTQLRGFLKNTLPDYMVPSAFVFLDALPLTPNGKVDRQALPSPEPTRPELESVLVPPRDPIEEVLAGIWAEVLGLEQVGVEDDFFALGGHSLLATQVISRIRDAFDVELPLRSLFEAPSVAGLARKISSARRQEAGSPAQPLLPAPRDQELLLSFAQQRLWFLDQLEPGNPFYTTSRVMRLIGDLDVCALEEAFAGVVARHESLRTRFESVDGRPVQIIEENLSFGLSAVDLGGLQQKDREAAIARRVAKELARPFDLTVAPLLRATLWRLSEGEHVLVVSTHHIVSDAWSMGILVKELAALYEESRRGVAGGLPRLPVQYADFARWQREWLSGEVLDKQLSYWRKQLAGMAPKLELPTDRPRPPAQSFRGDRRSVSMPKDLVTALTELSRREGTTLYMTLLAAFQTLLMRYTGQEDVVVGSPIAGRNRGEIEGLIGFFVNTLVLRTDISGDPSFRELLRRVRDVALGAYDHQDLPFEKLVEELDPERDLGANPLFQILFSLQNAPETPFELAGLRVMPLPVESRTTRFDLEVHLREKSDGLTCTFVYATDLFDSGTIVRMMGHYQNLLEEIVRDADCQVSQLVILSERERRQVLEEWNRTAAEYPREATVPELFERQVEIAPQAEALVYGRERLTYAQLEERSNRLARYLSKLGVGPEVLVGLCMERSVEMVVGLLGILKAGGAYVPLDPSYPSKRLAFMLEDTGARVVLTQESLLGSLPAGDFRRVRLDADWGDIARERGEKLKGRANSQNLAYVIYTSGSTGKPKGVAIEHRSTVALLAWAREVFSDAELGGVLASTSICFDLSVFELFAPLSWGGKVILAQNALELAQLSAAGEVKLVNTVPSAMGELLRMGELPESVETVNLAGEPLAALLVREILRRGRVKRVLDLYGPTEDTTYSTCARRSGEGPATIGRPISNKRVYILDSHLGPVPVGVAGDLYVAGAGIARGYLNRPELTAQKFQADPFRAGQRMYRTGDRARFLADGNIQFLGRLDHQVKIRGYRIEMGEIEEALARHPGIRACAVAARHDQRGSKRLVAYIVPSDGEAPTVAQLRDFLKESLPDYMVPSVFVLLQALPLTPNGKVDRQALPAPEQTRPELENAFVPPRNPAEETVAGIWRQVLGLERVGIHDNFFELGGHSLLATRVFARLQKAFPLAPPLRTLFEKPTVAELSTAIEDLGQAGSGSSHSPVLPVSRQAQSPKPPDPVQEPSWTATTKGPSENG